MVTSKAKNVLMVTQKKKAYVMQKFTSKKQLFIGLDKIFNPPRSVIVNVQRNFLKVTNEPKLEQLLQLI